MNTAPTGQADLDYDRERERRARWQMSIGVLVASLVLYHVSAVTQFALVDQFFDFAHYYLYARNLIEGRSLFNLEAPRLLAEQLGIRYADVPPNYPPPFYLAMSFLSFLPYHLASLVWLLLNELFLIAALVWRGAGRIHRNPVRVATLALVVLAFQPLYETLALGQANLMLLAGVVLAIRLWVVGSLWSGIVLGLVVLVKPQFSLLGLLWLRQPDWRHLGTAAGTVGLISLGTLPAVGWDAWINYFDYLRDFPCDISLWALNISLRGFLFRVKGACRADGFGDPLAVVWAAIVVVVLGMMTWYLWTHPPTDRQGRFRAASLILCVIYLVSPYTQEHHLTVLLMAFAGLALDIERPLEGIQRWGWVGAYALLATAYSLVRFPAVHLGLPSVLLFGKGLGIILLGALLATSPRPGRPSGHALLPLLLATVGGARTAHAFLKVFLLGQLGFAGLLEICLASVLLIVWSTLRMVRLVKA